MSLTLSVSGDNMKNTKIARSSKHQKRRDPIIQTIIGHGKTDNYHDNCGGQPDENLSDHPSGLTGEHSVVLDAIYRRA